MIVMTTRITERGRVKCGQYWPDVEGSSAVYGCFRVANKAVETTSDYVHTMLTVINDKVRYLEFLRYQIVEIFCAFSERGIETRAPYAVHVMA